MDLARRRQQIVAFVLGATVILLLVALALVALAPSPRSAGDARGVLVQGTYRVVDEDADSRGWSSTGSTSRRIALPEGSRVQVMSGSCLVLGSDDEPVSQQLGGPGQVVVCGADQ